MTDKNKSIGLNELFFEEALNKLHNNYHQLTKEEEEIILEIAKRIIG